MSTIFNLTGLMWCCQLSQIKPVFTRLEIRVLFFSACQVEAGAQTPKQDDNTINFKSLKGTKSPKS